MLQGHAGGIANAANAVGALLENEKDLRIAGIQRENVWTLWALMGTDDVAQIYKDKIHPLIDKAHMLTHETVTTSGLAHVRRQNVSTPIIDQGQYAIYFRPGASGTTMLTPEHLQDIIVHKPFNFNISYPGLFKKGMDSTNGKNLAAFAREAQMLCPAVSVDTHSPTKLEHVESALPHLDMLNMNLASAVSMFLERKDVDEKIDQDEKMELLREIRDALINKHQFGQTEGRCGLFTVTDKGGCYYRFVYPNGADFGDYLRSPYAAIGSKDKTGAGDVRFALQRLCIASRLADKWKSGTFEVSDAEKAIQVGQLAATLHIQGQESKPFEGVTIDKLISIVESGKSFDDIDRLIEAVLAA